MYQAPCRLYLTRDGRIVKEGDPEAHALFVAAGGLVPFQLARKYGLVETQAMPEAPQTQAVDAPPATKAITRKHTKDR